MTTQKLRLPALIAGFALALAAFAPPPKAVPVTSTIQDIAPDVAPGLTVRSDAASGGNIYYPNGSNLESQIQPTGDWVLDALNPKNATRKIYLNFSQPVPGSMPDSTNPVPLPTGYYKFRLLAACGSNGTSLLTAPAGTLAECPLRIGFTYNNADYALVMNKTFASVNGPFPTTDNVTVACAFPATGTCSQWKFTPSGSGGTSNEAKLIKSSSGKNQTVTDLGDFYLSFEFFVAK